MNKQFGIKTLVIITMLIAVGCAFAVAARNSVVGRHHYARKLHSDLEGLHRRPPSDLTAAQWECMVNWTQNLHSNSLVAFETSTPEIAKFQTRIRERLSGNVDATTIEWIWGEYGKVCPGGRNYQRFRLHVNAELTVLKSPVLLEPPLQSSE